MISLNAKNTAKRAFKIPKMLALFGSLGVLGMALTALAQIVVLPNPCIGTCVDVQTESNTVTEANIYLAEYAIEITVKEQAVAATTSTPVVGIPAEKVYVRIGTNKFYCQNPTNSQGKCTAMGVPSGFDGLYEIVIDSWQSPVLHDNVPFLTSNLAFDTNPHNFIATLFLKSSCDEGPPPARCNGDFLQSATTCDETDPAFPDGSWNYSNPGLDCRTQEAVVCPGNRGVIQGSCEQPSGELASCNANAADCALEYPICNFSQPYNVNHPQGFFKNGDVVTLTGQNFGTQGGEVRIGDVKIFIAPNNPNPNFSWTNTQIRFIVPSEARSGNIGVRPLGYEFQVGLNQNGQSTYIIDNNGLFIPVYCFGGLIKIDEFRIQYANLEGGIGITKGNARNLLLQVEHRGGIDQISNIQVLLVKGRINNPSQLGSSPVYDVIDINRDITATTGTSSGGGQGMLTKLFTIPIYVPDLPGMTNGRYTLLVTLTDPNTSTTGIYQGYASVPVFVSNGVALDFTGNNRIDIGDVVMMLRFISGAAQAPAGYEDLSLADLIIVLRYLASGGV